MTTEHQTMRTDLGSDAGSMARGASVNLLGSLAAHGIGFFYMLMITHLVAARSIGLVALGTTVVGFALILAVLGLDTGIIRFVARGAAAGDERAARGSFQAGLGVVCFTSLILTGVIWFLAPRIGEGFFHKPASTEILRIISLSLPALALGRTTMAAVQGFGVMGYPAWLGILRRVSLFAAVLPLIALGLEARALAWAAVISAWITWLIGLNFLVRVHPKAFVPARGAWPLARLLNFSVPQVMTATLFFFVIWTATLLLGHFRSASEVGVYAIVGTLLIPATVVSTAVGQMFAPRISAADAREDRATLAEMLKRVTHWNTAISLPFFTALALLATPALGIFGSRYTVGAAALSILAVGQLLNTAAGPLGQVINMSGRQYLTMTNNAAVAGLNVLGCLYLIPRYGMTGAACSTAMSLTIVNAIKLGELRLIFRMHPFQRSTLRLFLSIGLAAAVTLPIVLLPSWPGYLVEALIGGAVLFAVYAAIAWRFALTDEDRALFAVGRARIKRRLGLRSVPVRG
jgi:O-antigen/teichoic acid export membrane protein